MTNRRDYEDSHPWLTFELDVRRFPPNLWVDLGEILSKCDHIGGVPLAPNIADEMHSVYLTRGALGTVAIEGNTLSEEEAHAIVSQEKDLPPSQQYLQQELNNIIYALRQFLSRFQNDESSDITVEKLCNMNRSVLEKLSLKDNVIPGEIRNYNVNVGAYRCAPSQDCFFLLEKLCNQINTEFPTDEKEEQLYAVIKAIYAHLYFVWIHPFGDGNGRTARLLEVYILMAAGFPSPTVQLLSNHYNKTRSDYYRYLDLASKNREDGLYQFITYAIKGFVDGLREQVVQIKQQQKKVAWLNFVHQQFENDDTLPGKRQLKLILWLSKQVEPVNLHRIQDVPGNIPRSLFIEYLTGKAVHSRKLQRDIKSLLQKRLITRVRGKGSFYAANTDIILAFVPWRHHENNR